MDLKIAVLPGDGIGPEIMKQGVAVLDEINCSHFGRLLYSNVTNII